MRQFYGHGVFHNNYPNNAVSDVVIIQLAYSLSVSLFSCEEVLEMLDHFIIILHVWLHVPSLISSHPDLEHVPV